SFAVSPSGRQVLLAADTTVSARFDAVILNHDGTGLRTLATPPTGSNVTHVAFSPNAQRVSYRTRDANLLDRLFVVPVTGGSPIDVTPARASPTDATLNIISSTWSRDSRFLAIVMEATSDRLNELFVVDFNQGTPTPTALVTLAATGAPGANGFWGVVSPVEWSTAARNELVFKYRTQGNPAFRLVHTTPTAAFFGVIPGSPDGVTMGGYVGSFGIAADGLTVAYSADTNVMQAYEVYRTSLVTGPATMITSGTAVASSRPDFNRGLIWNPAGTVVSMGANYDALGLTFEPYVIPLPSGPQVRLAPFVTGGTVDELTWSPDGAQLAFVADWRTDETFELALASSLSSSMMPTPLLTPVAGGDVLDAQWTP
ncbi:MAG TPA: hypothetical protein VGE37_03175, partial [Archangium sp.]